MILSRAAPVFRPGTCDEAVWRSVVDENEYDLPDRLEGWAAIDIGAHIGSFTEAAVRRAVQRVYAFEPAEDNYTLLVQNVRGPVATCRAAVWRSDRHERVHFHKSTDSRNTGAGCVLSDNTAHSWAVSEASEVGVRTFGLDEVIVAASLGNPGAPLLVKLDCEGSELPILLTSRRLEQVSLVVGEYHLNYTQIEGLPAFTFENMRASLERAGLVFKHRPHGDWGGTFRAVRP